jgi:hypothetical protein
MEKVKKPKTADFNELRLKSRKSISNPAKNMMYNKPIEANILTAASISNKPKPCVPTAMPARINPTILGTRMMRKSIGASNMMNNKSANCSTGSLIGSVKLYVNIMMGDFYAANVAFLSG